jgi:hypothetical protein
MNGYNKASSWRAAGIGFICLILVVGYAFIRIYNMPPFEGDKMTFGNTMHEIYYDENIPKEIVQKVGEELMAFGYFAVAEKQTVQLSINDKSYCLKICVPKDWWNDADILESLKSLQTKISKSINDGTFRIKMLHGSFTGIEEKYLD